MRNRLSLTSVLVVVLVVVVAGAAPNPPQNLAASVTGTTATLNWSAPSTGEVPTGYIVEAALSPAGAAVASLPVSGTSLVVPNVPPGVYYVRVRSVNADGASAPSNEVIVSAPSGGGCVSPPNAPTNLSATVVGSLVTIVWGAPSGGCAPTGYVLQAGSAPGASNIAVANVGAATSLSASAPAGRYYVRVVAFNSVGGGVPTADIVIDVTGGSVPTTPGTTSLLGTWRGTLTNYVPRPGTGLISSFTLRIDVNPPATGLATRAGLWQDDRGCSHTQIAAFRSGAFIVYSMESLRCADGDLALTIRSVSGNVAEGTCSRGAACTFRMTR